MPLARVLCRSEQDALPLIEQLRTRGYTVETVAPGDSSDDECDLLLDVETCSLPEGLERADQFAHAHDDANIYIAAGVLPAGVAPQRNVPSVSSLLVRAIANTIWKMPLHLPALAVGISLLCIAVLLLVRQPAAPLSLQAQPGSGFEQQVPFGPVTIRRTPPPTVHLPGNGTPTVSSDSVVVRGTRPSTPKRSEVFVEDDVVIRHFRSRVKPSSRLPENAGVKHISDLD